MSNDKPDETSIGKRRREQVLAAAADCVRRDGFHRTSMSQISTAAGMSSGHIYHFFGSKEGIIAGVVKREHNKLGLLVEDVRNAARSADVTSALVEQTTRNAESYLDRSNAALMMEILAEASRNPEIAKIVENNDKNIREAFYQLLGDTSVRAQARCEIIAALVEGLSARTLRNPHATDILDRDMLRQVVAFMLTA